VRFAKTKGLLERRAKALGVQRLDAGEERDVGQVLDPGIRALSRHGVGVELLRDVRFERVYPERGGRDARETEDVVGDDDVGSTKDRIAECDVDSEWVALALSRKPAHCSESHAFILHALVVDLGVIVVGTDLEGEEISKIQASGFLELSEDILGRSRHAEIDILRGSRAFKAKLDDQPSLDRYRVAKHGDDPREEAIEHQKLASASKIGPRVRHGPQSLLDSLLERLR
jgi:hypothetical protein